MDYVMAILMEYIKNNLANKKTVYDYIQLFLPVVLFFLGWLFSYLPNKTTYRNQKRTEEIKKTEEIIEKIISLENELKTYVNNSINILLLNKPENNTVWDSFFQFFYCEANNKYNIISILIKINFPELSQNYENIIIKIREIEKQMVTYHYTPENNSERKHEEKTNLFNIYSEMYKVIDTGEEKMIEILYKQRNAYSSYRPRGACRTYPVNARGS